MILTTTRPVEGYIPAIGRVTLFKEGQEKKATFRAIVLDWDKDKPDWSMKTSNGVRYHRETTVSVFKRAIEQNGSLPIMYNHITDGAGADQLGIINNVIDTSEGMIIEGFLNMSKARVKEEIVPGFMKNLSLQVIAEDYYEDEKDDTVYAKPSRALEVSFVPVNGREGAKLLDLAIKESLNSNNKSNNNFNTNNIDMELARKAVAFEEIQKSLIESDISITYKLIESKLSDLDKNISELKKKGMSDKEIVKTLSKLYGVDESELDELLKEDMTISNTPAVTATKMKGVEEPKKESPIVKCDYCMGDGEIKGKTCPQCRGSGEYIIESMNETVVDELEDKYYESFINKISEKELGLLLKEGSKLFIEAEHKKKFDALKSKAKKVITDDDGNKHYFLDDAIKYSNRVLYDFDEYVWGNSTYKQELEALAKLSNYAYKTFSLLPFAAMFTFLLRGAGTVPTLLVGAATAIYSILSSIGLYKFAKRVAEVDRTDLFDKKGNKKKKNEL